MERVCIYLRKSRADEDVERELGHGQTLAKHKKALLRLSAERNFNIVRIYEELVSGEKLIHRPAMLELLKEVEQGLYDAVLVMDKERLGRGDMQEQGLILNTFKNSDTKIITPNKIYDLNNEFDEEYSEFEAFMSRREYKMITRRMQNGRVRSVEDGNYLGTYAPYGYIIHEEKQCRTLIPNPEQSKVIKLIFNTYVNDNIGCGSIASMLNNMGCKSYTGIEWTSNAINNIIKNPVYTGKIVWRKKSIKKSVSPDKTKDVRQRPRDEWIIADGKHPAIIDGNVFEKAQKILLSRSHPAYKSASPPRNPLAGLVICSVCGAKMVLRPYGLKDAHLICTKKCGNKSSKFKYVESAVLKALKQRMEIYKIEMKDAKKSNDNIEVLEKTISNLKKKLAELEKQQCSIHDLLERGIYDIYTFNKRSASIAENISIVNKSIKNSELLVHIELTKPDNLQIIKNTKNLIDIYNYLDSVPQKNQLLKSIVEKIEYCKSKDQKDDHFSLVIYPKF